MAGGSPGHSRPYPITDALRAEAIVDYPPDGASLPSVLTLTKGQIVYVLEQHESGWWGGHRDGDETSGWFPKSCLRVLEGEEVDGGEGGECDDEQDDDAAGEEESEPEPGMASSHLRLRSSDEQLSADAAAISTSDHRAVATPQGPRTGGARGQQGGVQQQSRGQPQDALRVMEKRVKELQEAVVMERERSTSYSDEVLRLKAELSRKSQDLERERQEQAKGRQDQAKAQEERENIMRSAVDERDKEVRRLQERVQALEAQLTESVATIQQQTLQRSRAEAHPTLPIATLAARSTPEGLSSMPSSISCGLLPPSRMDGRSGSGAAAASAAAPEVVRSASATEASTVAAPSTLAAAAAEGSGGSHKSRIGGGGSTGPTRCEASPRNASPRAATVTREDSVGRAIPAAAGRTASSSVTRRLFASESSSDIHGGSCGAGAGVGAAPSSCAASAPTAVAVAVPASRHPGPPLPSGVGGAQTCANLPRPSPRGVGAAAPAWRTGAAPGTAATSASAMASPRAPAGQARNREVQGERAIQVRALISDIERRSTSQTPAQAGSRTVDPSPHRIGAPMGAAAAPSGASCRMPSCTSRIPTPQEADVERSPTCDESPPSVSYQMSPMARATNAPQRIRPPNVTAAPTAASMAMKGIMGVAAVATPSPESKAASVKDRIRQYPFFASRP